MNKIDINNQTEMKIDQPSVKKIVRSVLKEKEINDSNVSIAFVGKQNIRELNKKYRKQDKATDVLSFEGDEKGFLGEIIIAPEIVEQRGECFQDDLRDVLIHAVLHLLGYDHIKQGDRAVMREEEKRLKNINN